MFQNELVYFHRSEWNKVTRNQELLSRVLTTKQIPMYLQRHNNKSFDSATFQKEVIFQGSLFKKIYNLIFLSLEQTSSPNICFVKRKKVLSIHLIPLSLSLSLSQGHIHSLTLSISPSLNVLFLRSMNLKENKKVFFEIIETTRHELQQLRINFIFWSSSVVKLFSTK